MTAAYLLSQRHDVTLIEKNKYLGGHTNTRVIEDGPDAGCAIDTGFIVCNPINYPKFYQFLAKLNIALRDSDMSFGYVSSEDSLQYVGPAIRDFLKAPRNLISLPFLKLILEQRRFNRQALVDLSSGALSGISLRDYFARLRLDDYFIMHYLVPLAASVWSSPDKDILSFPAETFVAFFRNHGMLELHKRPTWQTVIGGSHQYIKAFASVFSGTLRIDSPVAGVAQEQQRCSVSLANGEALHFDKVVLATHADESLQLISNPSSSDKAALTQWKYHKSRVVLHTDRTVLPQPRRLWASWNYVRRKGHAEVLGVPITYYMNRLQGLQTKFDYFVTLNAPEAFIDKAHIIYETEYTHPAYTAAVVSSRSGLLQREISDNVHYCGSYLGYGFHEDAVASACVVAERFGCTL